MLIPAVLLTAQETPVAETIVLAPRSELPASATGAAVQTVTGEELEATGMRSLPMALGLAAGVWVQETNLGGGSPVIRGYVGNQILIVIDGVRLNDSTTRGGPNQSLNGIDPHAVERVEIVRGPSSVQYGSDALGGVILIWTKNRRPTKLLAGGSTPEARRFRAELDGTYRSDADGGRGALTVSGASADYAGLLQFGGQDWDDLEAGDSETQHFTGYHGNSFFGSFESALSPSASLRSTALITRDFDIPRTDRLTTGFGQTQPQDVEHHFTLQERERYQLTLDERDPAFGDAMQARFSFRHYQENLRRRSNGSSTRRFESYEVDTLGLGVDWRKAAGEDHLLVFGFDTDLDDVQSSQVQVDINSGASAPGDGAFAPDSRYLASGIFVRDEYAGLEPLLLTGGLRYSYFDFSFDDFDTTEKIDGDFDALTGSLQATHPLGDDVRLSATISQGFRAPNLADLAKNGATFAGTELANPELEPEESFTQELALEVERASWSGSLAVFHDEVSDLIGSTLIDDPTPGTPGDETYRRDNVGRLRLWGVEARLARRLGDADSPFLGTFVGEWLEGRQFDPTRDTGTGEQTLYDVPMRRGTPVHGSLGLGYQPLQSAASITWAQLSWVWALEQDDLNPGDLGDPRINPAGSDGWNLIHLDFGGPLRSIGQGSNWSIGLHNLFDENYRVHGSGFDGPGFGVIASLHLGF